MNYEKPQKKNPHEIIVNQHVFPKASIDRFCNTNGCVDLYYVTQNKKIQVKPKDKLFCAKRAWDQKAESILMKGIEDRFQLIAEKAIVSPSDIVFSESETQDISRFYALWVLRDYYKHNPEEDYIACSPLKRGWTKDEQEQLEKAGVVFFDSNGRIPGRFVAGSNLVTQIGDIRMSILDAEYGVLRSKNTEFLVPDRPYDFLYIPITPNLCLYSKEVNRDITDEHASFINFHAVKSSREYYFSRNLSRCGCNA